MAGKIETRWFSGTTFSGEIVCVEVQLKMTPKRWTVVNAQEDVRSLLRYNTSFNADAPCFFLTRDEALKAHYWDLKGEIADLRDEITDRRHKLKLVADLRKRGK